MRELRDLGRWVDDRPLVPPPPVSALFERARRARRRVRTASATGAATTLLVLGLLLGPPLGGDGDTGLLTTDDSRASTTTTTASTATTAATETTATPPAPGAPPTIAEGPAPERGADERPAPPASTPTTTEGTETTTATAPGSEGCVAEGQETGTMFGGAGDWPRCSYTASRAGGYRAEPNTEFEVTLTGGDGYQRVIRGGCVPQRPTCKARDDAPSCAEGIIRPGDEVDVRILNTAEDGPGRIVVGDDIRC